MAKSKSEPVMLEAVGQLIPAGQMELSLSDNFDTNDVVSIMSARAEDHYKAKIKDAQSRLKDAQEVASKVNKQFVEAQEEFRSSALTAGEQERVDKLEKSLKSFGLKLVIPSDPAKVRSLGHAGKMTTELRFNIVCVGATAVPAGTIQLPNDVPANLTALFTADKEALAKVEALRQEVLKYQQDKNDIPALERRLRASVVQIKMKSTAGGGELLDALNARLDSYLNTGTPLLGDK